jgi:hypothetical protein
MTTPVVLTAEEQAAIPTARALLAAVGTFVTNLGPDPLKIPITAPGALQVLLGSVELQGPALATSEWGAVSSAALTQFATWDKTLAAAQAA